MKIKVLFLILLAGLIISCSKDNSVEMETITISGYVTGVATGDTLPNVKLRLRADSDAGSNQLKSFEQVLDSTFSDINGHYGFTLTCATDAPYGHDAFAYYGVEYTGEHLWKNPNMALSTFGCNNANNRSVDVSVIPLTWIKVHIKNESPASISDSIYYNGPSDQSSYENRPSWKFGLGGIQIDTTFFITLKANTSPLHYWDVTENGTTTRSAAYISCDPMDTCKLDIFY